MYYDDRSAKVYFDLFHLGNLMTKTARLAITIRGHPNKIGTKRRAVRRKGTTRTWTDKTNIAIQTE